MKDSAAATKKVLFTVNAILSTIAISDFIDFRRSAAKKHVETKQAQDLLKMKNRMAAENESYLSRISEVQELPIPEYTYPEKATQTVKKINTVVENIENEDIPEFNKILNNCIELSKKGNEDPSLLSNPDIVEKIHKNFNDLTSIGNKISQKLSEGNKLTNELQNELLKQINDLNGGKGSGSASNLFIDNFSVLIENFHDFLSSLTLVQHFSLVNILIGTLVLNSLTTIIFIFYSDFLIKFFNLEQKFPSLSKFIKIRKKFQQFYFLLNILIIIIAIGFMIFVNYLMFIDS